MTSASVGGGLPVGHGHESDAGVREEIQGIHKGRSHDPEDMLHAFGQEGFDQGFTGGHFLPVHMMISPARGRTAGVTPALWFREGE